MMGIDTHPHFFLGHKKVQIFETSTVLRIRISNVAVAKKQK